MKKVKKLQSWLRTHDFELIDGVWTSKKRPAYEFDMPLDDFSILEASLWLCNQAQP